MQVLERPGSVAKLTPYLLGSAGKGSVLVCPGGGYKWISPRESKPIANALNRGGYNAFVLEYTVEPDESAPPLGTKPLADAAWAMAQIRKGAAGYGIDPDKIAVCGFSAGGHLAASLGVYWHDPAFFGGEEPAEVYRPNALVLCYAVLSGGHCRHAGSFMSLAGTDFKDRLPYSLESQVSLQTPPTFLWHTAADESVPVQNSLLFAEKLAAYEIPFELHIYPFGSHGLSLATDEVSEPEKDRYPDPHVAGWMQLCINWLDMTL